MDIVIFVLKFAGRKFQILIILLYHIIVDTYRILKGRIFVIAEFRVFHRYIRHIFLICHFVYDRTLQFRIVKIKDHIRLELFENAKYLFIVKLKPEHIFIIIRHRPVIPEMIMPRIFLRAHELHIEILKM